MLVDATTMEKWLTKVFDHPVPIPDSEWWDFLGDPTPQVALQLLTELFTAPVLYLSRFTDAQIEQGLFYIMDACVGDHTYGFLNPKIQLNERLDCVRSFEPLFRELYARRCSNSLEHLDEPRGNPLNRSCFMWWDMHPLYGGGDGEHENMNPTCIEVMSSILQFDSVACQESAVRGLGLFCHEGINRTRCELILLAYINSTQPAREELRAYANKALRRQVY